MLSGDSRRLGEHPFRRLGTVALDWLESSQRKAEPYRHRAAKMVVAAGEEGGKGTLQKYRRVTEWHGKVRWPCVAPYRPTGREGAFCLSITQEARTESG